MDRFVRALTALYKNVSALTYTLMIGAKVFCDVDPKAGVMSICTPGSADMTTYPVAGDLTDDPWVSRIITAMLQAYPALAQSGVTSEALGKVDQQYHAARNENAHL